jgi:hypothetical protein
LKAVAKKFTTKKEELSVFGFVSKPVLYVKPKELGKRPTWLAFSGGAWG